MISCHRPKLSVLIPLLCLLLQGCAATPALLRTLAEDEGMVALYVQAFPPEASRLRFALEGLRAVREDGGEVPVPLALAEFSGSDMKRQRLIASGPVAEGEYRGLSYVVTRASMNREDGEASLLLPDAPIRINCPFTVSRKKTVVLALTFSYAQSIRSGFSFMPQFSAAIPDRPIMALTGYVSNAGADSLTVFDKNKMQAAGVIALEGNPRMVALDQVRRLAYVTLPAEDTIAVIDMAQGEVMNRARLNTGDAPQELALTPDGAGVITTNTGSDTVSILDTTSLLELARIVVGQGPRSVLMDRSGKRAYVFNTLSDTISVIDVPNRALAATVQTDPEPLRGQFNRKGDRLFVICSRSPYVMVLNTPSLTVERRVFVGLGISAIKIDPRTDLLYLGSSRDRLVTVYDPLSFTPNDFIDLNGSAGYMAIDNDENNLYVLVPERKAVAIVNLVSRKIVGEIDASEAPSWVAMMGER